MNVTALTPDELVSSLKTLVAGERMVVADIVEHLAEVTRRRLYVTSACTSLFAYCHEVLGIAEEPARHYVTVVYVVLEHPKVLDMLRAGTLHVSGVRVIAPALDVPDADERLEAAAGKTRNELERLVASRQPKPLVETRMTAVTFDNKQERLAWAVHSVPDGDVGKVVAKAIKLARRSVEKRKLGKTDKPKQLPIDAANSERAPDPGRAPSTATRREVSERDHDQCTYVSADGRRCSATAWLEFDHKHELAKGGETSTSNLRIFCRVHNAARNYPARPEAHPRGSDLKAS